MSDHLLSPLATMDVIQQEHRKQALAFLDQQGLDILVAASTDSIQSRGNVRYLTNYATNYGTSLAILNRKGITLFVPSGSFQLGWAKDMAWADEIRAVKNYKDAILGWLAEARFERGNVGVIGFEDLAGYLEAELNSALPDVNFKSVSKAFKLMKAVKTSVEITMARKSVELADAALTELTHALEEGCLENELLARASSQLSMDEAEDYFLLCSSGTRTVSPIPSGNRLQSGDVLRFSIEPASPGGFWTQTIRMFSLGAPKANFQAAFDLCFESVEAAKKKLRPGYTGGEVAAEIINVLKKTEAGEIGPLGHGMGLDLTEPPFMLLSDDTPLQVGMVITIHPYLTWADTTIWMGDTFLVTENEPEKLSSISNQLAVC